MNLRGGAFFAEGFSYGFNSDGECAGHIHQASFMTRLPSMAFYPKYLGMQMHVMQGFHRGRASKIWTYGPIFKKIWTLWTKNRIENGPIIILWTKNIIDLWLDIAAILLITMFLRKSNTSSPKRKNPQDILLK